MREIDWSPLTRQLDLCHAEGRPARFWLRDDDAVEPTPALSRLLEICAAHSVPAVLAVIPAGTGEALAEMLAGREDVEVVQHGWSHANHAEADQKKQELGPHRPPETILEELARGRQRLCDLFGESFVPVLVPPWNRIDKALLPRLGNTGLTGLSVFGPEAPAPLPVVNTHADIMDWHGTRGCRPAADIIADIVRRLRDRADGGSMGVLSHHLVHDAAAWDFLEKLMTVTGRHPGCRWSSLSALLPRAGQGPSAAARD